VIVPNETDMRLQLGQELAQDLLKRAGKRGASMGDVLMVESDSVAVNVRLGKTQNISQACQKRLGLRLFFGHSTASTATSDISDASLDRLLDQTCALAAATAQDEYSGLPDPGDLAESLPDLDLMDASAQRVTIEQKIEAARLAEENALQFDARINNSEGAEFQGSFGRVVYCNSIGFSGEYEGSVFSLSVTPVAMFDGSMQRDHWFSSTRKYALLDSPAEVGREAARRVIRRLGARKVRTQKVPVVFDSQTARSLLRYLSRAISGYSLYHRASFLYGKLGHRIASEVVDVIDDGTIPGALGSKPFDAEGVRMRKKKVVEGGVLASYLLDSYSARKLGQSTTGNAARYVGTAPVVAPTNLYLAPGRHTPEAILASVDDGFYATELMGFGVNLVTGDYSQGAAGIWIQNGQLAFPVEEVTIAGNLTDMLAQIEMVGNDLHMYSEIASPTIKVARMTVAGS
jgi:PmbA protein